MSNVRYAICSEVTGEILRVITASIFQIGQQLRAGETAVEAAAGELDTTHYAVAGELVPRPSLAGFDKLAISADDVDLATIAGLPDPCAVMVDGVEHQVVGGLLSISSPLPATYTVEIACFPYLPFRAEIVAA